MSSPDSISIEQGCAWRASPGKGHSIFNSNTPEGDIPSLDCNRARSRSPEPILVHLHPLVLLGLAPVRPPRSLRTPLGVILPLLARTLRQIRGNFFAHTRPVQTHCCRHLGECVGRWRPRPRWRPRQLRKPTRRARSRPRVLLFGWLCTCSLHFHRSVRPFPIARGFVLAFLLDLFAIRRCTVVAFSGLLSLDSFHVLPWK